MYFMVWKNDYSKSRIFNGHVDEMLTAIKAEITETHDNPRFLTRFGIRKDGIEELFVVTGTCREARVDEEVGYLFRFEG